MNMSGKFNSDFNTGSDLHHSKSQPGYTVINARIGVGTPDEKWTFELWADNLFDTDYIHVGFNGQLSADELPNKKWFGGLDAVYTFNGPLQVASGSLAVSDPQSVYDAFLGAPRTFGLTLRTKR